MTIEQELQATIECMVQPGKGILAADESLPTIGKRFQSVGVASTAENRRAYRSLLFTSPGIGEFISGVILFDETLVQKDSDGVLLPEVLQRQGIVPGVKVDKGKIALANAPGDMVTQGLDGLAERLQQYRAQGARFAKWREVYPISADNPTLLGIEANAEMLARYAAVCQGAGIVPIVEPEVLLDGDHSLQRCAEVSEAVLHAVFHALHRHQVVLEWMLLKPSMVLSGKEQAQQADTDEIAQATIKLLRRVVPAAVPSINFLSGGQTPEQATIRLNAINALYPQAPWALSFSYARALQEPVLAAWRGQPANVAAAQRVFHLRAQLNATARKGQYRIDMELAA